jgi:hypothetical protein
MGVGGQRHAPAALAPGKTRYPLFRRLGGTQGRSGKVRKILHPPGFDPQTVQPVASRYTVWAIPARLVASMRDLNSWLYCLYTSGSIPKVK